MLPFGKFMTSKKSVQYLHETFFGQLFWNKPGHFEQIIIPAFFSPQPRRQQHKYYEKFRLSVENHKQPIGGYLFTDIIHYSRKNIAESQIHSHYKLSTEIIINNCYYETITIINNSTTFLHEPEIYYKYYKRMYNNNLRDIDFNEIPEYIFDAIDNGEKQIIKSSLTLNMNVLELN